VSDASVARWPPGAGRLRAPDPGSRLDDAGRDGRRVAVACALARELLRQFDDLLAANGLGALPKAQYSRIYCGNGSFEACQKALQTSLQEALSVTPAELYGHGECAGNAQASCFDMNRWTSVSGISVPPFPFQNRPTFQQTIELQQALPR